MLNLILEFFSSKKHHTSRCYKVGKPSIGRVISTLAHVDFQHFTELLYLLYEIKTNLFSEGYFCEWSELILFLNLISQDIQKLFSIFCVELSGFTEPQYQQHNTVFISSCIQHDFTHKLMIPQISNLSLALIFLTLDRLSSSMGIYPFSAFLPNALTLTNH